MEPPRLAGNEGMPGLWPSMEHCSMCCTDVFHTELRLPIQIKEGRCYAYIYDPAVVDRHPHFSGDYGLALYSGEHYSGWGTAGSLCGTRQTSDRPAIPGAGA